MNSNCLIRKFVTYINLGDAGAGPNFSHLCVLWTAIISRARDGGANIDIEHVDG